MKTVTKNLRTWIEIDSGAAKKNYEVFRKVLGPKTKLWAVVKSNAYGHGLILFSKLLEKAGVDGFCVDSVMEGIALRRAGARKPILVLGPTLPALLETAAKTKLTITVHNFESLKAVAQSKNPPEFHIKIDTGMHRQGFYPEDLPKVIKIVNPKSKSLNPKLKGLYTHFATAKDLNYPTYTEMQFKKFDAAAKLFDRAGLSGLTRHCAATGGTFMNPKYHLDAVRIGIGLYGLWPSKELELQLRRPVGGRSPDQKASGLGSINLRPVLKWCAILADVKNLRAGDYVGYDLSERVPLQSKMAILPIGYWHGFPRALSSVGEVVINGKRAKVLGRVSMDLLTVDISKIKCKPGDTATMIGREGGEEIFAQDVAQRSGTTHYEFLTRLNPLMERVLV